MRYLYGMVSWIFGGLVLAGGVPVLGPWFGWVLLGAGGTLFMPPLWQMENAETPRAIVRMLRGPYLAAGVLFGLLGVACAGAMGSVVVSGAIGESIGLGFAAMLMFASGTALAFPVLRHARHLELSGRPQPLGFNVFEVVQDSGGRVTPAELAATHGVSYRHARLALLELVDEGACERIVARNGAVIFRFPELEGDMFDLLE